MRAIELILLVLLPVYVVMGYFGWRLQQRSKERRKQREIQQLIEENRQLDEMIDTETTKTSWLRRNRR